MQTKNLAKIQPVRKTAVAQQSVVWESGEAGSLPLILESATGAQLLPWYRRNRERLERELCLRGGILFRGFPLAGAEAFEEFVRAVTPDLMEYKERSTPRTEVGNRIYTSTEYPSHQCIAHHNEFSYSYTWPMRIFFFALIPPEKGGETPIADSRKVYQNIPPDVRSKFEEKGVMYVRNYGTGIDLSWQEAFQTADRSRVEEYCREAPVDWEWLPGDRLRTRQVRPAVARHPESGEFLWFNQAHLFHVSNLQAEVRASMREVFDEQDLPRNAYFGDGSPIPDSDLDLIREAYRTSEVAFPWRQGDVLLLDNMLVAHGRNPYQGPRRILAALSQPFHARKPDQRC
jgi:alpha-ketoglutarate-dependent taurine dioxygenase